MAAFQGFSTDSLVPLPYEFFSELVPGITDPIELKLTLHVFYLLSQRRGSYRRLSWDDLLADEVLQRSLRAVAPQQAYPEVLADGLDAAVQRGVLIHVVRAERGRAWSWYLANTARNRQWAERQGSEPIAPSASVASEPLSIFRLYEANIGLITPMLAEELREAGERYPPSWLEEAIREAIRSNVRNWRYIRRILERWDANGKAAAQNRPERSFDVSKYTTGKYAHLFERDGGDEPGLPEV